MPHLARSLWLPLFFPQESGFYLFIDLTSRELGSNREEYIKADHPHHSVPGSLLNTVQTGQVQMCMGCESGAFLSGLNLVRLAYFLEVSNQS